MQEPLTPRKKVEIEGKVYYSESFQAWNTIMLKKELFSEFPQLKEKRGKFSYKLAYCRSQEEFEKEMENNEGTLFILRIFKEN